MMDYDLNLHKNPKSKELSSKSGDSLLKLKCINQATSKKEIIRLYTNSRSKKKYSYQSSKVESNNKNLLRDIELINQVKPPSFDKIFPLSTKNGSNNLLSKLKINNITNNFHKLNKQTDLLFSKKKKISTVNSSPSKTNNLSQKMYKIHNTDKKLIENQLKKANPIKLSKFDISSSIVDNSYLSNFLNQSFSIIKEN